MADASETRETHRRAAARRRLVRQAVLAATTSLVCLVTLAAMSVSFDREYAAVVRELDDTATLRITLDRALQLLVDGETAQRGFMLTGDRRFLDPLHVARRELPATVAQLHALLTSKGETDAAQRLEAAIAARAERTEQVVALAETGDVAAATAMVATGEGRRRTERVRALVAELVSAQELRLEEIRAHAEDARARLASAFFALLLLVVAMAAYGLVLVRRELRAMDETSDALALRARESRLAAQRFRTLAESSGDLVRVHDREGRTLYASPSAVRLVGYTPDELVALAPSALVPEEDRALVERATRTALGGTSPSEPFVHRLVRKDGSLRWFETRIDPAIGPEGSDEHFHSASRDVTARIEAEAERSRDTALLAEIAHKDELTGLYNRRGFVDRAEALLEIARGRRAAALLVFCDVDGLKQINDALGHVQGDEVIKDAARMLSETAREADVVARLGGDELVVMGLVRGDDSAWAFERRLRERIRAHNDREERPYRLSISVGTALWRADEELSLDALMKRADAAMYDAKRLRERGTTTSGKQILRR